MSEDKDGGILKSELQKGEGYQNPKEGATCDSKDGFEYFICSVFLE